MDYCLVALRQRDGKVGKERQKGLVVVGGRTGTTQDSSSRSNGGMRANSPWRTALFPLIAHTACKAHSLVVSSRQKNYGQAFWPYLGPGSCTPPCRWACSTHRRARRATSRFIRAEGLLYLCSVNVSGGARTGTSCRERGGTKIATPITLEYDGCGICSLATIQRWLSGPAATPRTV